MADDKMLSTDRSPTGPNQSLDYYDESFFLECWMALEDDQFPSYENEEGNVETQSNEIQTSAPQGIREESEQIMIHGQPTACHQKSSNPNNSLSALFDLLVGPTNAQRKRNWSSICKRSNSTTVAADSSAGLSTEELIRIAGARFIQSSSDSPADPFELSFPGLTEDEVKSVQLVEFLLTAAQKVGDGEFEIARGLLTECELESSPVGDPVQRLVHYFSRALGERINRQTGKETVQKLGSIREVTMSSTKECLLEFYNNVPFGQVSEFAAIQAVVDSLDNATRIHIVDFSIRNGKQWTILMQALVSREKNRVDRLKITAIGTTGKEDALGDTGKRLSEFAQTMSLPFSFNQIIVEDLVELKEDMFQVEDGETIAVSTEYLLTSLISPVEKLDSVMKVIRNLSPCAMVVTEVESNHNSPVFVSRFVESLFYASAFFDCLEVCLGRESRSRELVESRYFGEGARIILATEGEERVVRNVKLEAWRAYFRRFDMEEADLSFSCVYQAELVANKFPCSRFCTIGLDGKSLIVGWKGTPINSVTAWKFNHK